MRQVFQEELSTLVVVAGGGVGESRSNYVAIEQSDTVGGGAGGLQVRGCYRIQNPLSAQHLKHGNHWSVSFSQYSEWYFNTTHSSLLNCTKLNNILSCKYLNKSRLDTYGSLFVTCFKNVNFKTLLNNQATIKLYK